MPLDYEKIKEQIKKILFDSDFITPNHERTELIDETASEIIKLLKRETET